jgi:hypothetical protein
MISKIVTRATAFAFGAAVSANQVFAMGYWPGETGGGHGDGGTVAAPELDGPGGIAAIVLLVTVAIVLFNRSRNR